MLSEGRKVIIFSQFTTALDVIAERLGELGITFSMLTVKPTRSRVLEFTEGESSVFLLLQKSRWHRVKFNPSRYRDHFDPWWNPAVEKQATDRAYRTGQTNPFCYKLIGPTC